MKNLAKILNQPERLVAKAVNKLEDLNGYPSEDARLLAENSQAVRQKIADLGLDSDDTTGEELYQALQVKFHNDSLLIDKALGIDGRSSAVQRLDRAVRLVKNIVQTDDIWVLKHNAAKKLLRDQPPKKLMKQLNYRSVESMLKREDLAKVYAAIPYTESTSWQRGFNKAAAQLASTDYELGSPEIIAMPEQRWQGINHGSDLLCTNSLIGSVVIWPLSGKQKVSVLNLSLMLLDGLEALSHSPSVGSIANINPALLWWEQAEHLMAICRNRVVSMNYKDVAQDHLRSAAYRKRTTSNGQASIWNKLVSRYENQEKQLQESIAQAENTAAEDIDKLIPKQPTKNLAVEYAEAIANEF